MFTTKAYGVLAGAVSGVVVFVWLMFSWVEADQEIRILCSMFHEGMHKDAVVRTLNTGEYLRYRTTKTHAGQRLYVDSVYNLRTSNCVIEFSGKRVMSAAYSD